MAFVRILTVLLKDKNIGKHIVPIVPDEARTFGMEGLFRQIGIYSAVGQLYTRLDAETLMSYREDKKGQMLEEGINEAGSICSWIAAATSYANHGIGMVPFYIYYSMFGFQRVGDFIWAAGDMRARGFLLGATAGRTTLAGEGLQHQDGHSQLVATTMPNCRAYDPTYAYELAVIIQDGLRRMYVENESVFYYISVMNENYAAAGVAGGRGGRHRQGRLPRAHRRQGQVARDTAGQRHDIARVHRGGRAAGEAVRVAADVYSITSFSELRREALECERWNLLHPAEPPRVPYVQRAARPGTTGAGDCGDRLHAQRTGPDPPVGARALTSRLGTDGFGRRTRAPSCAGTSKSIVISSPWRRSRRLRMPSRLSAGL